MRSRERITRADEKFIKELDELARKRFGIGKDKKLLRRSRLTQAITRHQFWQQIKRDILEADLKD